MHFQYIAGFILIWLLAGFIKLRVCRQHKEDSHENEECPYE